MAGLGEGDHGRGFLMYQIPTNIVASGHLIGHTVLDIAEGWPTCDRSGNMSMGKKSKLKDE